MTFRPLHALLISSLLPLAARADTLTLPSARDTTLYQSTTGDLSNGAGQFMFTGFTSEPAERRALLAFDLTQVPIGSTVTSASLAVNVSRINSGAATGRLHRLLATWGEGTSNAGEPGGMGAFSTPGDATWVHRFFDTQTWGMPGGDFVPTESARANITAVGPAVFASTPQLIADVQVWVNTPAANAGWIILNIDDARRLDTRENATPANRPTLTITFSPPCLADFNHSGGASVQDIFDFLTAYFTNDPAADVNHSGNVSVQDIFDFLNAYFAGC
jgi:hypothetical protein